MKHLLLFENWKDSDKLKRTNDITGVFRNNDTIDVSCAVCGDKVEVTPKEAEDKDVLCNDCKKESWYVDEGGIARHTSGQYVDDEPPLQHDND